MIKKNFPSYSYTDVVLALPKDQYLYFDELEVSKTHMSGMVVNGAWPLFGIIVEDDICKFYVSSNEKDCNEENYRLTCSLNEVSIIQIPESHCGDYNSAIDYVIKNSIDN